MNMKKLYTFPKRNLLISVPLVLVAGFVIGAFVDTSFFTTNDSVWNNYYDLCNDGWFSIKGAYFA